DAGEHEGEHNSLTAAEKVADCEDQAGEQAEQKRGFDGIGHDAFLRLALRRAEPDFIYPACGFPARSAVRNLVGPLYAVKKGETRGGLDDRSRRLARGGNED